MSRAEVSASPVQLGGDRTPASASESHSVEAADWTATLQAYAARAHDFAARGRVIEDGLALARDFSDDVPLPGRGRTLDLWSGLATLAAVDLVLARIVEPHLDARAILAQAGLEDSLDGSVRHVWGVFAAEGGPEPVRATPVEAGRWWLTGHKPWCSLGERLDRALVTAWVSETERGLFAVDLSDPAIRGAGPAWAADGLREVPSGGLRFDRVPAEPVGGPGWYLSRPGFWWGGVGVAAIWYGGAVGLARRLLAGARARTPDQLMHLHLGSVEVALRGARAVLAEAAAAVDAGTLDARGAYVARAQVAEAAETVLRHVDHALGPAPLATEPDHVRRVSDLRLYLRQHHAARDVARLGEELSGLDDGREPW